MFNDKKGSNSSKVTAVKVIMVSGYSSKRSYLVAAALIEFDEIFGRKFTKHFYESAATISVFTVYIQASSG